MADPSPSNPEPPARAFLRRSAVARYLQLAALFRNRIAAGTWATGTQIPTLEALIAETGVARATVRQALGELEKEGLIARERARGTFVLRPPVAGQWCTLRTDWTGMLRARDGARLELLEREDGVPLPTATPIGHPAPAYVRLRRRHWFNEEPFLLTGVFIATTLIHRIPPDHLVSETAIRMVADIPGLHLADAHQVVTAGTADLVEAEHLLLPLNAAVLKLDRFATGADGTLLVASFGTYRADIVRLDIGLAQNGPEVTPKG